MKNYMLRFVGVLLCLAMFLQPLCSFAAENNSSPKGSLTLTYAKDGVTFSELEIKIYRIAQRKNDGSFEKVSPYDKYPVRVTNVSSQVEWNEIAETLQGYVEADQIQPYMSKETDETGKVVFEGLEVGLYLVSGISVETSDATYNFHDFVIYLPKIEDGSYQYDVSAKPKSSKTEPIKKETAYKVLKLWKDEEKEQDRPEEITVDILKEGVLAETVVLNSANNWMYTFSSLDTKDVWSVVERNVPEGYAVKVTQKDTTFILINTWEEPDVEEPDVEEPDMQGPDVEEPDVEEPQKPTDKPQTGDIAPLRLWMTTFCLSGLVLIVLGVGMRRKENAFKK